MKTILVSGASGIVGYGVLRSLKASGAAYRLIGTTIYADSVAGAFCDVFEQAPPTGEPGYLDWLLGVIRRHGVDAAIPGIECDMLRWSAERAAISAAGCAPVLNTPELIALCEDKWIFFRALEDAGSPYRIPTALSGGFDELAEAFGLPLLLKPRRGFASRGIVRVATRAEFEAVAGDLGPLLMAQPLVGDDGEEYTATAFFDREGEVRAHMGLRRTLASAGFTEKAEVVDLPELLEAMRELGAVLKPLGPTNFQFRRHGGQLKLLEVNPRISSSTSIRAAFGYNEAHLAVEFFLNGVAPAQPAIGRGRAIRYVEDCIIHEDRTDI